MGKAEVQTGMPQTCEGVYTAGTIAAIPKDLEQRLDSGPRKKIHRFLSRFGSRKNRTSDRNKR